MKNKRSKKRIKSAVYSKTSLNTPFAQGLFGAILIMICTVFIFNLLSEFYRLVAIDPWPQLIVIPTCYTLPFVIVFFVGIYLIVGALKKVD